MLQICVLYNSNPISSGGLRGKAKTPHSVFDKLLKGEQKTYQSFFTITRSNFTQILTSTTKVV